MKNKQNKNLNLENVQELTLEETQLIDGGGFITGLVGGLIGGFIVDFITNDRWQAVADGWNSVG